MSTKLRFAAALAGAAALVCASGALAASSIAVVEHATSDTVTDVGDTGDSVGDILTFANDVYDAANAQSVGSDNGWCVRTQPGKAWECFWTTSLKDGQITVEGPFLDAGDSALAITGGTGAYASARGEMKLHARNADGTEYDFVFNLAD